MTGEIFRGKERLKCAIIKEKMKKEDLIIYEMPTIGEFACWSWLQEVVAKYTTWKIRRKWARYQLRLKRREFFYNQNQLK